MRIHIHTPCYARQLCKTIPLLSGQGRLDFRPLPSQSCGRPLELDSCRPAGSRHCGFVFTLSIQKCKIMSAKRPSVMTNIYFESIAVKCIKNLHFEM